MSNEAKCPFSATAHSGRSNRDWWPNQLNLNALHTNHPAGNPMGEAFDYAAEFKSLDLAALKKDIEAVMTNSQDWWPADFGHYGPLFIRMAWHTAGTYRIHDGRGGAGSGQLRFAPLGSWPDNANLDKARRLLWPIKQKYGRKISWADLMVLTGNVALESMGFKTFGFAGGRKDVWEPEHVNWGSEATWLGDERYSGDRQLANPFGAVQMGLIYVNPEGPNGNPDPVAAARDIRETFRRMAMNDEETVALIAGGHTFGKTHGAAPADKHVGREPEGGNLEEQGFGWKGSYETGKGAHAITSGLEVTWTTTPTKWSNDFFKHLFEYEWELTTSPAGAKQWKPKNGAGAGTVPHAHDTSKKIAPSMLTTDLALRFDPAYEKISRRFKENPQEFADAFAKAWFKLTHRDMGPHRALPGPGGSEGAAALAGPGARGRSRADRREGHRRAEEQDPRVGTVHVAAGLHGLGVGVVVPRHRQARRRQRRAHPPRAAEGLGGQQSAGAGEGAEDPGGDSEGVQRRAGRRQEEGLAGRSDRDRRRRGHRAGGEEGRRRRDSCRSRAGRTDASQEQTDVESFAVLEPDADGFRNFIGEGHPVPAEHLLIERAFRLTLSAPEMTVLIGGLRVLGANAGQSNAGVFTKQPGTLTNDFFVNLLDMDTEWMPAMPTARSFKGRGRAKGDARWTASRVDLGLRVALRAPRASPRSTRADDSKEKFVRDFAAAWTKVMNLDRFDVAASSAAL